MESLEAANIYILGAIGTATLLIFYFLFRTDVEAAVEYHVEPPVEARPGWKGEVLEEPSLKVCLLELDWYLRDIADLCIFRCLDRTLYNATALRQAHPSVS